MDDRGRLARVLRRSAREAGRRYERARQAYWAAHDETLGDGLPTDRRGRARLVCRRYADRRAVAVDAAGRPACFDAGHPDCEGCREDVLRGRVETW